MNIESAIFDMDGTLINSLIVWDRLWDFFGKKFFDGKPFCPTKSDDKAIRTMTTEEAMHYLNKIYNFGVEDSELLEIVNKFDENFYKNEVELKKGALEFLEYLYQNGVKMCIASATDKRLIKVALNHCGIEKYFDEIFSCCDIGSGKDKPDIFLKALEYLGTSKEKTCIFEDSHVAIVTASKAGFKTVGIYDRYNYGQEEIKKIADAYIADGESLEKLINSDWL